MLVLLKIAINGEKLSDKSSNSLELEVVFEGGFEVVNVVEIVD